MPITNDTVAHMAVLARLDIDASTQERFTRQFVDILGYMEVLRGVDTEGVEPLYSPVQHGKASREDVVRNCRTREQILENAPEQDGRYFVVPRIV